jgi:hypothetical protein
MSMINTIKVFAVCVGAPLLALGVAAPTAWAAPPTDNGATVSINGNPVTSHTGSTAMSTQSTGSKPNIAVAVNGGYSIAANGSGSGNRAVAVNNSFAAAGQLVASNNTATAINNSSANAGIGANDNTARAINNSLASTVPNSDNNTATATCGGNASANGGTKVTSRGTPPCH